MLSVHIVAAMTHGLAESSDFKVPHWIFTHMNTYLFSLRSFFWCCCFFFHFTPRCNIHSCLDSCRHVRLNLFLLSAPPPSTLNICLYSIVEQTVTWCLRFSTFVLLRAGCWICLCVCAYFVDSRQNHHFQFICMLSYWLLFNWIEHSECVCV